MIRYLLKQRFQYFLRTFRKENTGQLITVALFLCIVAAVGVGVYFLLSSGFTAVADNTFLQVALPYFIYELFLLTVFGLVFTSAVITCLFLLFRNEQDVWVMASPKYRSLLYEKFTTISFASLWPLLVVAVPALAAMQSAFSIGLGGMILGFLVVLLLGVLATASALIVVLGAATILYKISALSSTKPGQQSLLSVTGILILALYALAWIQLSGLQIISLFQPQNLDISQASVENIREYFSVFPTHIGAEALSSLQTGAMTDFVWVFAFLALLAGVFVLCVSAFSGVYLRTWQYFQEGAFEARPVRERNKSQVSNQPSSAFSDNTITAILKKEWITTIRNKRTIFWLGFLTMLWLIVTSFDIFMQNALADEAILETVTAPQFVQVLQLVVVGYFVAALVLRLVFPAFSMERDTAWSIMTAPLTLRRLFWSKAVFHVAVINTLSVVISLVHIAILSGSVTANVIFVLFVLVMSTTLTLFGLGLGARFPNFRTSDPEKLSTTLPGLAFVGMALLYCAGGAFAYYLYFSGQQLLSLTTFIGASVVIAVGVSIVAVRALPKTDFSARVES